ncbi:unnamed protein product [Adineta steineri]|uniref:G-protein coupled receptors family 1 profile domain-containing protein n=1 Tax=Adineta steineri TaxID=433720 RepID=A0A818TZ65_9BILA|nr:unnamed protein product [Adineta steineri]CAF3690862.1 unnamed protein product [Adineta steineri]
MVIPALMAFGSYRNVINFYFASAALSSSLLNCLYIYYLVETLRSRGLAENTCRAIYYLQTSCTVVLAYTITAMHANFVLCLLSPPSSNQRHSVRSCLRSCGFCLRRFFRRFCFCLVLVVWSLSFTATIPLLYTIDSNEKTPKPVYCPGTKQISYLEEWFDRNRLSQSIIFNLIPLLATLFISIVALLKLFYECLFYTYLRCKMSKCLPCRKRTSSQHQQQSLSIPNSTSMLSSFGIISNSNIQSSLNLAPITESPTPTSEATISSSNFIIQSCGHWCSSSFLRFLLVLSCCLLACIYPIAMRFYLVYFSVLVPLIFAVLNYSLGQLTPLQTATTTNVITTTTTTTPLGQPPNIENRNINATTFMNSTDTNSGIFTQRNSLLKRERACSSEQFELQTPLMDNIMHEDNDIDDREQFLVSPSTSSQSSTMPTTHATTTTHVQHPRMTIPGKQKYFSNNLYENYNRNVLMK